MLKIDWHLTELNPYLQCGNEIIGFQFYFKEIVLFNAKQ